MRLKSVTLALTAYGFVAKLRVKALAMSRAMAPTMRA